MAVIKRVSLVDQVYEKLRERIVQLKIPFGSKLNVSKLQEEYGVSSTPVREALNRLLNEGLINLKIMWVRESSISRKKMSVKSRRLHLRIRW